MELQKLIRAYDVGRLLGYSTWTIKKWAKAGRIPGAVFIGRHVKFDAEKVGAFIRSGGKRPEVPAAPKQSEFIVRRHGVRAHAGNAPRNDRIRRDPARELGDLVKPDPGVREFDPLVTAPGSAQV